MSQLSFQKWLPELAVKYHLLKFYPCKCSSCLRGHFVLKHWEELEVCKLNCTQSLEHDPKNRKCINASLNMIAWYIIFFYNTRNKQFQCRWHHIIFGCMLRSLIFLVITVTCATLSFDLQCLLNTDIISVPLFPNCIHICFQFFFTSK